MNASDGILRHCVPQNDIQPVILNEVKNPDRSYVILNEVKNPDRSHVILNEVKNSERIDRDSMHRKGA